MTRIPFSFDIRDGLAIVRGTASLDGDTLVLDTTTLTVGRLGYAPTAHATFRIPADEVESIEVRTARFGRGQLVVRPFTFSFIAGFPGDPANEVVLPVERKYRDAAEALANEVRLRNLPR